MLGRDASLLLPWQQDIARMDRALLEFVSTEFDEDSRSMQHAALLKSMSSRFRSAARPAVALCTRSGAFLDLAEYGWRRLRYEF